MEDLMGRIVEYNHLNQQTADQQITGKIAAFIGYIGVYNIERNECTVICPINSNDDPNAPDGFRPMEYDYMPLGTGLSSRPNSPNPTNPDLQVYGSQQAIFGGASINNPTGGEQVLVIQLDPFIGYTAAAILMNNTRALPPGSQDIPVSGVRLQNGEYIMVTPGGNVIHCDNNNNINVYTQVLNGGGNLRVLSNGGIGFTTADAGTAPVDPQPGDIDLTAHQDINAVTQRDLTLTVQRDIQANATNEVNLNGAVRVNIFSNAQVNLNAPIINIGAQGEGLFKLLTESLDDYLAFHTHSNVQPGVGVSGPPVAYPPPAYPFRTDALNAG